MSPPNGWPLTATLLVASGLLVPVAIAVFVGLDTTYLLRGMPFILIGVAGSAVIVWDRRPGSFLLAGVLVSLPPLMALTLGGFTRIVVNPRLGANSVGAYLATAILLVGLPAGVVGYLHARDGTHPPSWLAGLASPFGAYAMIVLGVAAGLMLASILVWPDGSTRGSYDLVPAESHTVLAKDFAFTPADLAVATGKIVEIRVDNRDPVYHTFTYSEDGIGHSHHLAPNTVTRFLVRFDAPGTITYWSIPDLGDPVGDAGPMSGTITVQPSQVHHEVRPQRSFDHARWAGPAGPPLRTTQLRGVDRLRHALNPAATSPRPRTPAGEPPRRTRPSTAELSSRGVPRAGWQRHPGGPANCAPLN